MLDVGFSAESRLQIESTSRKSCDSSEKFRLSSKLQSEYLHAGRVSSYVTINTGLVRYLCFPGLSDNHLGV